MSIEVANQLKKGTAIEISNPLYGSMGEWFKPAHCYRAEPKGSEGSNPSASAINVNWKFGRVGLIHQS